jgi:alkanesulfonate monooxygenase SsuD/methylene tetrahydromethanopterin reductase-like flavin-dependent oxidoreductase (luciferase family)
VKLLPLHHPVRLIEDMCTLDQLSGGRLDFGVDRRLARGVRRGDEAPAQHPRPHRGRDRAGAGTPGQIAERFAGILEPGLTDYLVLQIPCGDMTFEESLRTLELFATEVKPQLEKVELAA